MSKTTSQDGTSIAFDRTGAGPAVILVGGALSQRAFDPLTNELAEMLSQRYTVYTYDRRGRGESGDTAPYAIAREVEDIDALINEAGGSAFLYGISSGAALALAAAAQVPGVTKLALYEPPFIVDDSRPPLPDDYVEHLDSLIAEGKRGDAVEYFMTAAVGMPAEFVAPMREQPFFAGLEAVAHTIAYDGRIMGDTMSGKPLPAGRWTGATMPTLVMTGGNSEPFMHNGNTALAALLPDASHQILAGQDHAVQPRVLAPVLNEFFGL